MDSQRTAQEARKAERDAVDRLRSVESKVTDAERNVTALRSENVDLRKQLSAERASHETALQHQQG